MFKYILLTLTIVSLLCLISILISAKNKSYHDYKLVNKKIVLVFDKNTFSSNLIFCFIPFVNFLILYFLIIELKDSKNIEKLEESRKESLERATYDLMDSIKYVYPHDHLRKALFGLCESYDRVKSHNKKIYYSDETFFDFFNESEKHLFFVKLPYDIHEICSLKNVSDNDLLEFKELIVNCTNSINTILNSDYYNLNTLFKKLEEIKKEIKPSSVKLLEEYEKKSLVLKNLKLKTIRDSNYNDKFISIEESIDEFILKVRNFNSEEETTKIKKIISSYDI